MEKRPRRILMFSQRDSERITKRTHIAGAWTKSRDVANDETNSPSYCGIWCTRYELGPALDTKLVHDRTAHQHIREDAGRAADIVQTAALITQRLHGGDEQRHMCGLATGHDSIHGDVPWRCLQVG